MLEAYGVRTCLGPPGPSGRVSNGPHHPRLASHSFGRSGAPTSRGTAHSRLGQLRAAARKQPRDTAADSAAEKLAAGEGRDGAAAGPQTELIFKLERRGSGWGEEILPHLTVEQREVQPPPRRNRARSSAPEPWENGSLEWFLEGLGVPAEKIEQVVIDAVAWRVTGGGRLLIDRRRRARVERNMKPVALYLHDVCGVPQEGVGTVISAFPKIMLCKPSHTDRWSRRCIELAAYVYFHGNCNVPMECTQFPDLPAWVKRQRQAINENALAEEREQLLISLGFKFGEAAAITEEWEDLFDELIEWRMWHQEQGLPMDWNILLWGAMGGPQARRLAIWVQLQREFRKRGLLPDEGCERLEFLEIDWQQPADADPEWFARFGQLIYLQEEALLAATRSKQGSIELSMKPGVNSADKQAMKTAKVGWRRPVHSSGGRQMEANLPRTAVAAGRVEETDGGESRRSRRAPPVQFSGPSQEVELDAEPGVRFWLAKQRWRWRRGLLPREEMLLLGYAAVDMDVYGEQEWAAAADSVAAMMEQEQLRPVGEGRSRGRPRGRRPALSPIAMQRWVLTQNALWRQKGLSPSRLAHIQEAGLSWVLPDEVLHMGNSQWARQFQEIADIIQAHGPARAPRHIPEDLAEWILLQRYLRGLNLLPAERAMLFAQVDLDLMAPSEESLGTERWEAHFEDLLAFRQEHGHCEVPPRWDPNPFLPIWLRQQVAKMREGDLPEEQMEQLVAVGVLDEQ